MGLLYLLICIWCLCGAFISPLLMSAAVMNFTGRIYQIDPTMDRGTAPIIGAVILIIWLLLILLPNIFMLKRLKKSGKKHFVSFLIVSLALIFLGFCAFDWDFIAFFST